HDVAGGAAEPGHLAALVDRADRRALPGRVHDGQPQPGHHVPGLDRPDRPAGREHLGLRLDHRAGRDLAVPDADRHDRQPPGPPHRRRRGQPVLRYRKHQNDWRELMATNEVATAAGTVGSAAVAAGGPSKTLDGMSLEIAPGELVALLGPSGCGKTTALRIVAGFETADTGEVLIDGKDVSGRPAAKRDMGMVFQSYSLFPNMSALDNVGFGLRMRKANATVRRRKAGELLEMVGLSAQSGQFPHQLSGGQQQRGALARALDIEPRELLLVEPLSALDAKVRLQLREQIRTLQKRLGTTRLFVTHDQEE